MNVLVDGVSSQVHTGVLEEEPQVHCIYYERVFMLNHLLFSFYISAVKKTTTTILLSEKFSLKCVLVKLLLLFLKNNVLFLLT